LCCFLTSALLLSIGGIEKWEDDLGIAYVDQNDDDENADYTGQEGQIGFDEDVYYEDSDGNPCDADGTPLDPIQVHSRAVVTQYDNAADVAEEGIEWLDHDLEVDGSGSEILDYE